MKPLDLDIRVKERPLPMVDCRLLDLRPPVDLNRNSHVDCRLLLVDLNRNRHNGAISVVAITALAIAVIMAFVDPTPSSPETQPNPPSSAHSAKK